MSKNNKFLLLAGTAALLLGGVAVLSDVSFTETGVAYAQKSGSGGQGKGSQGGSGQGGSHGGSSTGHKGQGGHSAEDVLQGGDDSEDSDRPDWAGTQGKDGKPGRGNTTPGISKGGIFGDMYALLRDENGVPILTPEGFVQPIDADGNPIPLDEEGHPLNADATVEVELGRLNVGRSPTGVLSSRLEEAISIINQATAVTLDEAGRLLLTIDGEQKTIDSPLENLAIYIKLMNDGTLGLSLDNSVLGSLAFLNDGTLTAQDVTAAASFLAGASDKYAPLSVDSVVYLNTILNVDGSITQNGTDYVDFSSFTYDRSDVYENTTAEVLIETSPGVYETKTVNIYDTVFSSQDYSSTSGIDGFTQAADDARAVIAYVHDNSAPE